MLITTNALHKSTNVISGKTRKPLSVFGLIHSKWSHDASQKKRKFLSIYLVTWKRNGNWPFLLPITNSIKMNLNFQSIIDNPLSKYPISFKRISWMHCLFLEYVQWVSNSTSDRKIPGSNPTDVLDWVLEPNLTTRVLMIN